MGQLDGKVAIVTGANTGIGKETARGLAKLGATVVLACRDLVKGQAAREELAKETSPERVHLLRLDLGDLASIRQFATEFSSYFKHLHILVNNAGVWTTTRSETKDGLETTFGTNHVGTFALTRALLPVLKASTPARIVNVSSDLHYRGRMRWDDLQHATGKFSGPAAYNQSKLANVLFSNALARRLANSGITVNSLHPGVVATELARHYPKVLVKVAHLFMLTPEEGARTSIHVATAPELAGVTGKFFDKSREKVAAKAALDEAQQERLWTLTEAILATKDVRKAA